MQNCVICGILHKRRKYCSRECQYEGLRRNTVERIVSNCLNCSKEFKATRKELETKKYCSRKCKDQHQQKIYCGENNPFYGKTLSQEASIKKSKSISDVWKTEEHREKVRKGIEAYRIKNGFYPSWSPSSRKNRKESGKAFHWGVLEVRNQMVENCILKYGKTPGELGFIALSKSKITSIEQIAQNLINDSGFKYKREFRIFYDSGKFKSFDFLIEDCILLEIDGDYWHANPSKYSTLNQTQKRNVENDLFKNDLALNNGYCLIRIWESDIAQLDLNEFKSYVESKIEEIKVSGRIFR